jgi:hypothetical protein
MVSVDGRGSPWDDPSEPAAPVRVVFAGGIPTILPADDPLGYYVRAELLPDRRWRMSWRGFDVSAERAAPAIIAATPGSLQGVRGPTLRVSESRQDGP